MIPQEDVRFHKLKCLISFQESPFEYAKPFIRKIIDIKYKSEILPETSQTLSTPKSAHNLNAKNDWEKSITKDCKQSVQITAFFEIFGALCVIFEIERR